MIVATMVLCTTIDVRSQFSAKVFHDGGKSNEWPGKMIKTSDGNIAVCGYADSVLKTGFDNIEWADGRFLPRISTHVVKMRPDGQTIWKRKFTDDVEAPIQLCAKSIAETKDEGFVITGWARVGSSVGKMDQYVGRGQTMVFVLRLNKDGNEMWRRYYQTTNLSDYRASTLTRISAGDVLVRPNGNIVIVGVAEMVSRASGFQNGVDFYSDGTASCFRTDLLTGNSQNSSRYLWLLEFMEQDTIEYNLCPRLGPEKTPVVVRTRLFMPNVSEYGNTFTLDYKFNFTAPELNIQTGIRNDPDNYFSNYYQDQVFASLTQTDDNNNKIIDETDGYAVVVNTTTRNLRVMQGNKEILTTLSPKGFSILKLDASAYPQWWRMFYSASDDNNISTDLGANCIINYNEQDQAGKNRIMVCGWIIDDKENSTKSCVTYPSDATPPVFRPTRNMMLSQIRNDGTPELLWHFGSRVVVYRDNANMQNEEAYSIAQLPLTGDQPEIRRYSDKGVTMFGGRYSIPDRTKSYDDQERGFYEHNAWALRLRFQNNQPNIEQSSSLGQNHDDHFVSGVIFPDDPQQNSYHTFALGHTTTLGYRNTLDIDNGDLWVARLNNNLLFDTRICGSTPVQACMVTEKLRWAEITPYYCDESYLVRKWRHCYQQNILEEAQDECQPR
jgi:hypothetical protein